MSEGSGIGTAAAVLGGIGAVYWLAMATLAVAAFTVAGVLVGVLFAVYVLWGVTLYLGASMTAVQKGSTEDVVRLIGAPLAAPIGFMIGIVFTGPMGIPSYIEMLNGWTNGIQSDSLSPGIALLGFPIAIVWTFAVWPFIFVGWLWAGYKGFRDAPSVEVWVWWFLWGVTLGVSLDPDLWQQFFQLVF